jgi:type II secretory pathway component PulF
VNDPAMQRLQQQTIQRFVYLATVTFVLAAVLVNYCLYVAPTIPRIVGEYDVQGTFLTHFAGRMSETVAALAGPIKTVGIFELPIRATLAGLSVVLGLIVFGGLYLAGLPVLRPVTDRLTMFRHRSRVMQLLAAAFEQGQPVDAALMQLCHNKSAYPSRAVRRRIAAARKLVVGGGEWQDALWRAGLIGESDVVVLRSAQAAGNLPWALRLMADRKSRLALFRLTLLQQALFVGLALAFGLAVLLVGAAVLSQISAVVISQA